MTTENRIDILFLFLGICMLLLIAAIFLLKFIVSVYIPFVEEREFIRTEITRTHGNERMHWEHELKRLYISQIPFIGVMLAEKSRRRSREQRRRL